MSYSAPVKYKGTGTYGVLTPAEQATWDEYTNLRQISDWPGFDQAQNDRKTASRLWVTDRMDYITDLAQGKVENQEKGWNIAHRGQRYDFLSTLNSGSPKHEVRLPCPATATDKERVYIEEREVYLTITSQYDEQKSRKLRNVEWLVDARKRLYRLMKDSPDHNDILGRPDRYKALCIATNFGSPYKEWDKTHNKWGVPYEQPSQRQEVLDWCSRYLGVSENPAGSNKGHPQPSNWQNRVYGSDGVPWCACYAGCSAWDAKIDGAVTASVGLNTEMAKRGQGIYRGFTTDPSKVGKGDHFFIGTSHTGVVRGSCTASSIPSFEGNTSPGQEGSQYNGGTVAEKVRSMVSAGGTVTGFGLVRFND